MKRTAYIGVMLFGVVLLSACTTNKKKKCNTCPKWTYEIHTTDLSNKA